MPESLAQALPTGEGGRPLMGRPKGRKPMEQGTAGARRLLASGRCAHRKL